jgi:hypothetical protein
MSDWLHNLPVAWMALVVFGATYLVAAVIYTLVMVLAVGERARSFKAISAGMLPPLGIIFGLFVAFTAAQVWQDNERANTEVNRERQPTGLYYYAGGVCDGGGRIHPVNPLS